MSDPTPEPERPAVSPPSPDTVRSQIEAWRADDAKYDQRDPVDVVRRAHARIATYDRVLRLLVVPAAASSTGGEQGE